VSALLAAVGALVWIDRIAASDDSGQVTLLVLLMSAALLGYATPRRAWLAGLVLGSAIAVANLVYVTLGSARAHPISPPGAGGAATLLLLIVPAMVAAYAGAAVTRRRWPSRSSAGAER
jgi:branched-subunit amino acid ABC-type transport system permease component